MARVRFVEHSSGREIGTARLAGGRLVADTPSVQQIVDGKVLALDLTGLQATEFFASWSNGYIGSSLTADPDDQGDPERLRARPSVTIGVDLAASPVGTAVVEIAWAEQARARLVHDSATGRADTAAILDALARGDKVGVDCPFGWPEGFVDAVAAHRDRDPWPTGPDAEGRRALRLRATDEFLASRFRVNSLSVSSDRIGVVAMRWAALMTRHERTHSPIARDGSGRIVEVYPALALRRWNPTAEHRSVANYKKKNDVGVTARRHLMDLLEASVPGLRLDDDLHRAAGDRRYGHDTVDALLAALVAAAAATPGCTEQLPDPDSGAGRRAASEGWIAIPTGTSLTELAPTRTPWLV